MASTDTVAKQMETVLVLRGIVTLIFGVAAVFWPGLTLVTLIYLFGAYILAVGIITIVEGFWSIEHGDWWFLRVLLGIFELGVGVYMLRHPHITFSVMILLIGFALIARGVIEMVAAFMEDSMTGWGRIFAVILGLLAIAVGVIMLFQPVAGGVTFVWVLGLFALVTGPMELAAASHIRKSLKA